MKSQKIIVVILLSLFFSLVTPDTSYAKEEGKYIKWIDFKITSNALKDASEIDISTKNTEHHLDWISILSYFGQKYGGDFSKYSKKDLNELCEKAKNKPIEELCANKKLYEYYKKAYGAVLGGMLGEYYTENENGERSDKAEYGIKAFSPIARGYSYNHYDDFGASRSYGYKRHHLGHDIMGSIGTPVIAVESGYVEALGWNQYGGWRIGIRSFDGQRYYYYAHLRKDNPYNDLYEGKYVSAGEVIGFLGMTGYSSKENVNNINVPHLHYGLQIIFDKSQKDGANQIWIDMYEITKFLSSHTSLCQKSENTKIYTVKKKIIDSDFPD